MASSWTPERTETAKKLWAEGYSASQIATVLGGVSRNAVIGKLNRIGANHRRTLIQRTRPTARSRKWNKPKRQPTAAQAFMAELKELRALRPEPWVPVEKPHIENPKPLLELENGDCRFPVTDDRPFLFCDRKAVPGLPYCEGHAAVCFDPKPPRPPRPYVDWHQPNSGNVIHFRKLETA